MGAGQLEPQQSLLAQVPVYIWSFIQLPYEIPGSENVGTVVGSQPARATLQLVEDLVTDFNRILYLTSSESPDYALQRELGWLDSQFNKLEQVQFNGEVFSMLVLYSPSEQEE